MSASSGTQSTAHSRSSPLRKWLRITAALLIGLLLLQIVFDPLALISDAVSVPRIRWELPRAMEHWHAHAPSSCQIRVKGAIPLACILDGELSVRDGQLVGIQMCTNAPVPDSPVVDVDPDDWDQPYCSFRDLAVEAMFERVENSLEGPGAFGTPLSIEFIDERGHIKAYRYGCASGGGVLAPTVSDCCIQFRFDDLRAPAP